MPKISRRIQIKTQVCDHKDKVQLNIFFTSHILPINNGGKYFPMCIAKIVNKNVSKRLICHDCQCFEH